MKQATSGPKINLLPKVLKKIIGNWIEMEFDAEVKYCGITWLRVKDGMGGRGDREDWVADVPAICISVHDYYWNGDDFGPNYGSFVGAMKVETKNALDGAIEKIAKLREEITMLTTSCGLMRESLEQSESE